MISEEAVICQGLIVSIFFFLASFQILLGRFDNETSKDVERWNMLKVLVQIIHFLAVWTWACHLSLGLTFFHLDKRGRVGQDDFKDPVHLWLSVMSFNSGIIKKKKKKNLLVLVPNILKVISVSASFKNDIIILLNIIQQSSLPHYPY